MLLLNSLTVTDLPTNFICLDCEIQWVAISAALYFAHALVVPDYQPGSYNGLLEYFVSSLFLPLPTAVELHCHGRSFISWTFYFMHIIAF